MLMHAPWAREAVVGTAVLDAFAGTGALGLEALSRGAASACFLERDRAALTTLRANIASCRAGAISRVMECDTLTPPPGTPCGLVFLDPPYGQDLVPRAVAALSARNWIAPGALLVAETGRDEVLDLPAEQLTERAHGAARLTFWRMTETPHAPVA